MQHPVQAEVAGLHRFFEQWFRGELADTDEAYARFADAMAPGFHIVTPEGRTLERERLVADLRAAWGSQRDPLHAYRIRVEDVRATELGGGLWLARYEEWHELGGAARGRVSSGLLREGGGGPGGFVWLHVHETWLD